MFAAVLIDTVPVGNAGNPNDTHGIGYGAVAQNYRIGTYEVTNAQYTEFLNSVDPSGANTLALYSTAMSTEAGGGIRFSDSATVGMKYEVKSGRENNPVIEVSWYDAARFANWLHNGQGAGSTETGAYTLLGGTPTPANGTTITRNGGAMWFLPNEDEWYKAAYHKNDGVTGNYWDYPTSTDDVPSSDQPPGSDAPTPSNTANFFQNDPTGYNYDVGYAVTGSSAFIRSQNYLTDVGSYASAISPYGTYDQGGNVWEWNEDGSSRRGGRGGFWSSSAFNLLAANRSGFVPTGEFNDVGFRVASVPEPRSFVVLLGLVFAGGRLRRQLR